jgi:hypothetical protein
MILQQDGSLVDTRSKRYGRTLREVWREWLKVTADPISPGDLGGFVSLNTAVIMEGMEISPLKRGGGFAGEVFDTGQ